MKTACPILNRTTQVEPTIYSRDNWQVVRCSETGLHFLANPPAYQQLETEFSWDKTGRAEQQRRQAAEPLKTKLFTAGTAIKEN